MRLTKFNEETGQYESIKKPKNYEELTEHRNDMLQRLGEFEDRAEGVWIEHIEKPSWLEDDVEVYYNCSVCGTSHWSIAPPFCPNCGAKMKGADDEQRSD
jgi:rubrerythrin